MFLEFIGRDMKGFGILWTRLTVYRHFQEDLNFKKIEIDVYWYPKKSNEMKLEDKTSMLRLN